ncbi:MAG TPA: methionyl-tRNA formyltransferase [Patescibacteria group bacterium]|nr:methionyl-tRNA formyltransferase [Patescibacteria group bacterium]
MKLIYFGTPDYSVKILDAIYKNFRSLKDGSEIVAVVTQKPKPSGRDQQLSFSAVDTFAYHKKIPILFSPDDIIKKDIKADIGVLASYGEIISDGVIKHFHYGIINFHPSLLPEWRGASPVQASIVSGTGVAGGTFMKLDELLDHGPIISQFKEDIFENDTTETLRSRLFDRASEIIPGLMDAYVKEKIHIKTQNHSKATIARQIKKEESFIPGKYLKNALAGKKSVGKWTIPFMKISGKSHNLQPTPYSLNNFIRAMNPWPISWTNVQLSLGRKEKSEKRLKIIKAHLEKLTSSTFCLVPDLVQLEGKSPVAWTQFLQGYPVIKFE